MSLLTNETLAFSQLQTLTETPSHYSDSAIGIPMQINCVVKSTAVDSIGRLKSDYKNEFTGKILNLLI